jgi:hypothetical protein
LEGRASLLLSNRCIFRGKGGGNLAEEKKGHIKITIDIEMDESVMEVLKNIMVNMPKMMSNPKKK